MVASGTGEVTGPDAGERPPAVSRLMSRHQQSDARMPAVRTTLRLDDDVLIQLKKRASEEGLTLSEVVNLALRQSLAAPRRTRRLFRQKTRDLGRPSFDVTKANAVAAALEDETILRKLARSS
jgi:hypothetical protein